MSKWLNGRTIGWTSAGVILAVSGILVVLFAGGSSPRTDSSASQGRNETSGQRTDSAIGQKSVLVRVRNPQRMHLKRQTTQAAHVEAYEKVDVYAKAAGYVQKFAQVRAPDGKLRDLDIGDRVRGPRFDDKGKLIEPGQVLVELWIPETAEELQQKKELVAQAEAEVGQSNAAQEATRAMVLAARAQVEQARADLGRLTADLAYRKGEYDRYQGLLTQRTVSADLVEEKRNQFRATEAALETGKKVVSKAEADFVVEQARQTKAEADVASAKARHRVAEANQKLSEVLLEYARIRASFDGVLTRRLVDTGTFVRSAAGGETKPLFTLARVDRLRVITEVPEADSPWIQIGQPAVLQLNAARGYQFTGKVARFADALDRTTHTMTVEVELNRTDRVLRPGLYGDLTIILADYKDALTLPTSALISSEGKPTVMVVEDGKARSREVVLGLNDGILMQITSGLTADDGVITDGKDGVRDGQPVTVVAP